MESEVTIRCQWSYCINEAVKHAAFGVRVFDAPQDMHVSDSSQEMKHLDLCLKHLELISLQYVHVNEYELGECPNRHPDPS
jgi:hypothetical protein